MLSADEIITDLKETQIKFLAAIEDNENSNEAVALSLKISMIITWFMQNGYVEY